jgi:hypothetical protein
MRNNTILSIRSVHNLSCAFALLFLTGTSSAQDYVDIFRASANFATMGNENNDQESSIYNQQMQLYLPKRFSEKFVLLSGFTLENTSLNLFSHVGQQNLQMARLNMGAKIKHSDRLSATYLVLPKIASNMQNINSNDFQIGGLGVFYYKMSQSWQLNFGLYVSSENHGSTVTPLLGVWHRSKNEKFFINAVLPIRADISYNLFNNFNVGADLLTSIKSYDLSQEFGQYYVQEESIRGALYASYGFLDNSLVLRARGGLDLTDYSQFNTGDKIGAQVLVWAVSGDNRSRINSEFSTSAYFGLDLIYRYDLRKEKK